MTELFASIKGTDRAEVDTFLKRHQCSLESALPLADEASARRYFRIQPNDGKSQSLIFCIDTPFVASTCDFLQIGRYLKEQKLQLPHIIDFDERGWFLIEDGGETLDSVFQDDRSKGLTAYRFAIDELIRWQNTAPPSVVAGRSFDFDKLWWELEFLFARLALISEKLQTNVKPGFELQFFLRSICEHLASAQPQVLTHRDFHSRNILISDRNHLENLKCIDYQDARMGLGWYDLSSLLYDPYSDLTFEERRDLLTYYREKSNHTSGKGLNQYYLQALQRLLKALGSYLFLTFEKNKPQYIHSIEPALRRIEEVVLLGHFPDTVFLFAKDMRTSHLPAMQQLLAGQKQ